MVPTAFAVSRLSPVCAKLRYVWRLRRSGPKDVGMAEERTPFENAVAKLILLAEVHGVTIDDLIAMLNSGASVKDIVVALSPHKRLWA